MPGHARSARERVWAATPPNRETNSVPAAPAPPDRRVDLTLHIGTGKTGTTTIQKFLRTNSDALGKQGILYPLSAGVTRHGRFGLYVTPEESVARDPLWHDEPADTPASFHRDFRSELLAEIARAGLSRVLISDEGLYGAPAATLRRLRQVIDAHFGQLRLVCYLRRQDDHLASRYQQVVKMGETRRLAVRTQEMDLSHTYDYASRLDLWTRLVGCPDFVVRRFEPESFVDASLIADFLDAAGITLDPAGLTPVPAMNESLDAESVEFLRILNLFRVRSQRAEPGRIRNRKLVVKLARSSRGPTLTLPEPALERFMARWESGNEAVARRYFGEEDGVLFRSPRRSRGTTSVQRLDPDRLDYFLDVTELPSRIHPPLRRLVEREAG